MWDSPSIVAGGKVIPHPYRTTVGVGIPTIQGPGYCGP